MQFRFVSALFFAVLVTLFAVVNAKSVDVNFLFINVRLSLAVIIFGSAAIGALIVALLGTVKHMSQILKMKGLEKTIQTQLKEIESLKNQLPKLETPEEKGTSTATLEEPVKAEITQNSTIE